jgi:BirA family biotin operon repressor/biotin-[acetyl-CoA-carboxylase] ligase
MGGAATKDKDELIVERLREASGSFVSGTDLAELLGVSRAAVGKRIDGLRKRGLSIEAVPNRGYRLVTEGDSLEPQDLTPLLNTSWLGRLYLNHAELTSTNDEARRMATEGAPHGTVVVADRQTEGRGRLGRSWHSPPGENLYLSTILRPDLEPAQAPPVTLTAAVGVAEGIRGFIGRPPTLKWPNDLLYGGRKVCGLLTEMSAGPDQIRYVVIGIGLNINTSEFPGDLAQQATSLSIERGGRVSRVAVLASVINSLEHWIDRLVAEGPGPVIEAWQALADWFGQSVTVSLPGKGAEATGVALGLDPDGALRLRLPDGAEQRVVCGDVKILDDPQ